MKLTKNNIFLFTLFIVFTLSCKKEETKPNFDILFNKVFQIIKTESIKKEETNWTLIEETIKDSIPKFLNNNDVHKGIDQVLDLIDDKHSFFLYPGDKSNFLTNDSIQIPVVKSDILEGNIGYIKILGFAGNDSLSTLYSLKIRESIEQLDNHSNLNGWIIDLRNNIGGKIGMIPLGISPLYKDSIIGLSYKNDGTLLQHRLLNDKYFYGNKSVISLKTQNVLKNNNKKIAVLVNENTASQGEFTALSLKFQNNTKIFGSKTKGLTSDVQTYSFASGAFLGVTNALMCNENKEIVYEINPDIECPTENSLELAIEWIKQRHITRNITH